MPYLKYLTQLNTALICTFILSACGGGSGGDNSRVSTMQNVEPLETVETIDTPQVKEVDTTPTAVEPTPEPPPAQAPMVRLTGTITYDRVQFDSRLYRGLDYDAIEQQPSRGATVHLLSASNTIIDSSRTNDDGEYSFEVALNTSIKVRIVAELFESTATSGSIQIRDNTSDNALYVLDGSLVSTGTNEIQTRNMHAGSGWDGSTYSQARSSGPFAILDSLYDAVKTVTTASPDITLPSLNVYWSSNNIALNGSLSEGNIGTSFYTSAGPSIYLLGAANNDSDEFDRAVVQHEFGHYVEHQLSRTESLGGSHNVNSLLDLRVAFGEAWGNAFAGMASGDPLYRDSLGVSQGLGFAINVEDRSYGIQGWFSEGSIQSILYNLFDSDNNGDDNLSLGFKPIFDVLTSNQYLEHPGFASIYSFIEILKQQNPNQASEITQYLNTFDIYGTGFYGEGETNDGRSDITLPVYGDITLGQSTNICSDSVYQNYNGYDVYRFLKVDIRSTGTYSVRAIETASTMFTTNPQIRIYQKGVPQATFTSSSSNIESGSVNLSAGTYIIEVFEQANASNSNNNAGGRTCFDVTID